ncbi:spermatogenesis-associated protein 17 isoform X2 [Sphaerodactylus townsendi]|uniref:spermatogenesis-associated protein 17 isoform X2 n=1 Tax=Sphaerodactylus townsendi TaxID=933632 RepID=UPI0020262103|nr:spermatogenesis-associated protein 17 isoform X2 [Sphaerodactylus townsendi]
MATLARLQRRLPSFKEEFFQRNRHVNEYRKMEYYAAVKIQSWFRGCKVRAYIRYLNKMMVFIQKWWRGYQGRKQFRRMTEIQKTWRGYYIRKYIHNYYALKKYLEAISLNNEIVRRGLEEFAVMKEKEEEKQLLEREEKKKDYQARKMHYLLSTQQIAGVYNSPYLKFPDPMELQLRKAKPLSHKEQPREGDVVDFYQLPCTDHFTQTALLLPPTGRQKPQGPFRDTVEVLQQRLKPFEPSLRVAASDASLEEAREKLKEEEWRNRVHDDEFLPFASCHKPYKYIPSMQRSSKYGKENYGLKYFRAQHKEKWITNKDFITALPPIHLFGKFGKTYSRAGEIV